jgi:hypothetical protein
LPALVNSQANKTLTKIWLANFLLGKLGLKT